MTIDTELLNKYLHEGIVIVIFTKADGTERVMKCTLSQSYIPQAPFVEGNIPIKKNPDVIRVFDVEVKAWRSFRYDSVKEIKV